MRNHKPKALIKFGLIVAVATLVVWLFVSGSRRGDTTVSFLNSTTNSAGGRLGTFNIANATGVPVVCPGIFLQTKATGKLTDVAHPQIRLEPNEEQTFTVTLPSSPGVWRLGINHYREDLQNRIKIRLDMSRWRSAVPARWQGVRGENIWTDWITE
jgi:hypothetical protein